MGGANVEIEDLDIYVLDFIYTAPYKDSRIFEEINWIHLDS